MGLFKRKKEPELPVEDDLSSLPELPPITGMFQKSKSDDEIARLEEKIQQLEKLQENLNSQKQEEVKPKVESPADKSEEDSEEEQEELTEEKLNQIIKIIGGDIMNLDVRLKNVEAFCFKHRSI